MEWASPPTGIKLEGERLFLMKIEDFFKEDPLLCSIKKEELLELPFEDPKEIPGIRSLEEGKWREFEVSLDGVMAIGISKPKTEKEKREFINRFLSGLRKLLSEDNNWTFFQAAFSFSRILPEMSTL